MAGNESLLSIIIRTVDKSSAGLASVSRSMEKISRISKKVGKSMTANLTLPILAIGAASTKAMANFESGMSSVSTLVDTSTESIDDMGKSVLAIGRNTPVAISDLTSGLYDIRSAGISAGDAMKVLEKSAQLGVAGLGTTKEAADLVTSSINAFQLKGQEAADVYDNIFKTVKNGKTNIAELSQGFGAVAGTVAASGTKLDEYLASVAALTTTGLPAAQAHTQLRAVFAGLTRDTAETSKVFKELGVRDFKELIEKSGGLVPALESISESLDGNETKLLKLVGSMPALGAMTGLVGKQNKSFVETLHDMRIGTNAIDAAFQKQSKTSAAAWQKTKNSLTSAGVSIGKILAPALSKVAEKLQELSTWFESLDPETKEWMVTIAGVVAVIGPALIVFAKLSSVIGLVATAIRVVSSVMMANPIAALVTAIGLAAIHVYRNWEEFEQFFALIWDGVKSVFSDAWDFIKGIVDKIMEQVDKVATAAKDVKAYLTGEQTSGDKEEEEAHNARVRRNFASKIARSRKNASESAVREFEARQSQRSVDAMDAKNQGPLKNEITLTIEGAPARVKSMVGPAAVDVKTGFQAAF